MRTGSPVGHDQRLVRDVGNRDRLPAGQRVSLRERDHRRLLQERLKLDALVRPFRWTHERKIERTRQQPGQQPDRLVLEQLDRDLGMSCAKIPQQRRQQPCRRAVDRADPELLARTAAKALAEASFNGFGLGEQRAAVPQQHRAVVSQRNRTGRSREEPCAQVFLQQFDMPAKR